MPVVSRFCGIVIYMFWCDHPPPHFHAKHQGVEISIEIETGIVKGQIKTKALDRLQDWRQKNESELIENWYLSQQKRILKKIGPLE